MKRKNKALIVSLIIIFTVLFTGTVSFADDELDYIKGRPLTDEEIAEQQALEPELQTLPKFTDHVPVIISEDSSLRRARGTLPVSYDIRQQDFNSVIRVKNQEETGLCWVFSTTSVAEISRAKQLSDAGYTVTPAEFSPLHLGYFVFNRVNDPLGNTRLDKNKTYYNYMMVGSNNLMVMQSLANWMGLVSESTMPFESRNNKSFSSKLAYDNEYILDSAELIADGDDIVTQDAVKEAIMENGSVLADLYYERTFLNYDTSAYYNAKYGPNYTNHMIAIVGWDDSYSKNNFRITPENDGAWIIQNSYSSEWGDGGYAYVSYEDLSISCPMAIKVKPADTYDYNYQYDGNSNPEYLPLNAGKKMANVFKVPSTSEVQSLEAIGFTSWNTDKTSYLVDIYTNVTGTTKPTTGNMVCSFTVTTDNEGYFTFDTPESIELQPGTRYSIVITMKENANFGIEGSYDDGIIEFTAGQIKGTSFYYDSNTWYDLYYSDMCARIKGFTVESKPIDISNATVTLPYSSYSYSGNARKPLPTVKYNGRYLKKDIDYTLEYEENIYPGEGYVYINGTGDFEGKLTKSFYIAKASSLSVKSYGTNSLTLKWGANKNVDGYKVYQYTSNGYKCVKTVNGASTTSATIKNLTAGKGYTFRVAAYVDEHEGVRSDKLAAPVKPKKGCVKKLTTGSSHYVKATWYKMTGSGYQVKRATNSKFTSNVKTYKITSLGTLSKKMTGLKKGKTYYVKVRAYKTYGGKTAYGPWSGYKKIKCK